MSVHLRDDDGTEVGTILKCTSLRLSSLAWRYQSERLIVKLRTQLTDAGIENHNRHVRLDSLTDLNHLLEELGFLLVPSGRVHDNNIESLLLEFRNTLRSDGYRVCFRVRTEVSNFRFRCGLTRLVECTGTESIGANDT